MTKNKRIEELRESELMQEVDEFEEKELDEICGGYQCSNSSDLNKWFYVIFVIKYCIKISFIVKLRQSPQGISFFLSAENLFSTFFIFLCKKYL